MQVKFIAYPVRVLGPGKRIGIWTTGCNRRCPYCTSPSLWEFDDDLDVPVDNLIKQIENYKKENVVDGIVISGGEPFLQKDLIVLLEKLRELQIDDILVYTGYLLKEIKQEFDNYEEYLKNIDVLIDGPYVDDLNDGKNLRGSSNQNVIVFNEKLKAKYDSYLKEKREYQIKQLNDMETLLIGLPFKDAFKEVKRK